MISTIHPIALSTQEVPKTQNKLKNLLTITALAEFITGIVLIVVPSTLALILFGSTLDTPVSLAVARVAGIALTALGIACWIGRTEQESKAVNGLIAALLIYNAGISILFIYVAAASGLTGIGLWPVVIVHVIMAIWCVLIFLKRK